MGNKKFRLSINKSYYDKWVWYAPFVINIKNGNRYFNKTWRATEDKAKALKWLESQKKVWVDHETYKFVMEVKTEDYLEI